MKNKMMVSVIIIICLLLNISAFATTVTYEDFVDGIIKVTGKASGPDKEVNILVVNSEDSLTNAESNASLQELVWDIKSDNNSYYSQLIQVKIPASAITYTIRVKENGVGTVAEYTLYFATMVEKVKTADNIIKAASALELETMLNDSHAKDILAVNQAIVNSPSMSKIAATLFNDLKAKPITLDMLNINGAENKKALIDLQNRIFTISIVECYNESKSSVLFDSNNLFSNDDIMQYTTMDTVYNTTIYNQFSTNLTKQGKQLVQNGMLNRNVKDAVELKRVFTDLVMYYGITNNIDIGYGHISNYLTENNLKFANNGENPMPKYTALSDSNRSLVNMSAKRIEKDLTINNYKPKIEQLAKDITTGTNPNNPGSPSSPDSPGNNTNFTVDDVYTPPTDTTFNDLNDVKWAEQAILYLKNKGVISGVGENKFDPSKNVTREQIAKIICLSFDVEVIDGETGFSDVSAGSWYVPYVMSAKNANILKGITNTTFGIEQNVTRQDLAVMIYRAINGEVTGEVKPFSDASKISDYAKDPVNYLKQIGVANGYEDGSFKPTEFITRAETCQIIYNAMQKGGK